MSEEYKPQYMKVTVGVDMGGTRIKIGFIHKGNILEGKIIPARAENSLERELEAIAQEINATLLEKSYKIEGIGIAFPGIVDSSATKICSKYVKYPDAATVDLKEWASKLWGIPVVLENDVRAALFGEWCYGAGHGTNNLVMITLGTGVGSAVLINGQMIRGANHLAGNLGGHMTINLNGRQCNCGHIGCLESESSTWMLEDVINSPRFGSSSLSNVEKVDFASIFEHATQGDSLALQIRDHSIHAWALGIINMVLAYDPERVVIGGGVMHSKDLIIPRIKELIQKNVWLRDNPPQIRCAEQLEYAGILGLYHLLNQGE